MKSSMRSSTTWWRCVGRGAKALFLVLAPALAPALHAQEAAVYIVGSRLPVSEAGLAQPVKIVRPGGEPSLVDALRTLPDVHLDQPGAPAGFASLYLRGADPNHPVYLLDGVKVNDPTSPRGGGFDLGSLDPQLVERVEILAGASSAIYGADAMAGVVNLLTPPPRSAGARLAAGLGGLGYRRLSASLDGASARVEAAALEDGGERDLGYRRVRSLALRMPQISLRAWQHEQRAFPEDSGGPQLAVLRELERRDTTSVLGSAQAGTTVGPAALRLRLGALAQEQHLASPGVAPGVRDPFGLPPNVSTSRFHRWNSLLSAELGSALVGAEYQLERGDSESFDLQRTTRSLFGEAGWNLARRLALQGGLRLDKVEGYASQANVQAGARYALDSGSSIGARIGTGFRPPSFFALGHPIVGNPELRPEKSRTAELSFSSSEQRRTRHRLSLFRSRYNGLIDFDPGPPPRLVNRSEVMIDGMEYSLAAQLSAGVAGAAGFSLLSFELPDGAGPLRSRPKEKASASLEAGLPHAWRAKLSAIWVGRTFDSSIPTGARSLPPYLVVDAMVSRSDAATRLSVAVDNLFDREYQQFIGFPAPRRRMRVEISRTF